jgi:RNA polymerase sigma factor (sigma-70 family)
MQDSNSSMQKEVDHLYKKLFGKMVASLLHFSKNIDIEVAEDIVQDSFSKALTAWKQNGIPDNPAGWIYRVAKNKAYNTLRAGKKIRGFYEDEDFFDDERPSSDEAIKDEKLKMLFSCAHPDLPPKVQIVITLKYIANLKVEAIAKSLAMGIDGIDKLLLRARQKIREEKILLSHPDLFTLKNRLHIVHKVLYLIFNEGYKSSTGQTITKEDLCEEALILTKILIDSEVGNKVSYALYALMLFNAARLNSRLGEAGELLDLESQNRLLWNKSLIELGRSFLEKSLDENPSTYHLQATIAFLHCSAKDFKFTDWLTISNLYSKLLELDYNPFIELNHAISLYYAGERIKAKHILAELKKHPFLSQYYLLNVALGKIAISEGMLIDAVHYLKQGLSKAHLQLEKDYIAKLLNQLADQCNSNF